MEKVLVYGNLISLFLDEFKTKINWVLQDCIKYIDTEGINPVILWEGAKAVLRGEIISYAS